MIRKELKSMFHNSAYWIVAILPLLLTFLMSQGTKQYLESSTSQQVLYTSMHHVSMYSGLMLQGDFQFAVSELSFMVMMISNLVGLNVFEERRIHVFDRVPNKKGFIAMKFGMHVLYAAILIVCNTICYKIFLGIHLPIKAILIFFSISLISIPFGIVVGLYAKSRVTVSNIILMLVMLMGYFGGALSLTSVLANTRYMKALMYGSILTIANKLVFKTLLGLPLQTTLMIWSISVIGICVVCSILIVRRIDHGAVI